MLSSYTCHTNHEKPYAQKSVHTAFCKNKHTYGALKRTDFNKFKKKIKKPLKNSANSAIL